jgi:hypothetical protein
VVRAAIVLDLATRRDEQTRVDVRIDPLLLVAMSSRLAGESAVQDNQIRNLLTSFVVADFNSVTQHVVSDQIASLIGGPTKSAADGNRMLREMAAKAKSQALVDAIREIDPTIEARVVEAAIRAADEKKQDQ